MSEVNSTLRIIFVGNTNVGKTALNLRFIQNEFNPESASTLTPTSSNITTKTLEGKDVTLQLWDTAGQERFQSLSQVFYRDANIAIICVDGADNESFKSVQLWKSRVLDHEPHCICVVAITKVDLVPLRAELLQRCEETKKSNGIDNCYLTSSKTGEGVKEMFGCISSLGYKEILQSPMNITSTSADNKCVNIETKVNKKKKKECC